MVDGASPDATQEIANQLITLYGANGEVRIPPVGKLGRANAYVNGLEFATANFVIIMDADLAHNVSSYDDGKCYQKLTMYYSPNLSAISLRLRR